MYTICYVSNTHSELRDTALEALFSETTKNNTSNNITGILLYESGNFLQVLEGDEEILKNLFDKIKADSRHRNIFVILSKTSERKIFKNYASGFSIVKSKQDLLNIKAYLDQIDQNIPNLKYVKGILEPFLL